MRACCLIVAQLVPALTSLAHAQETYKLVPSDGQFGDLFGNDLDLDGDLMLVAAGGHDHGPPATAIGAAYVFDSTTGTELFELYPSTGSGFVAYGQGLAVGSGRIVVGAWQDNTVTARPGIAYVYDRATGAELMRLSPNDVSPGKRFGYDVDIDGDRILVTAPGDGASGAGYLFDLSTGQQLAKWIPSGPPLNGGGLRGTLDGNFGILCRAGVVSVFDVSTGTQLYSITGPGGLGVDVDAEGGVAVFGAFADSTLGTNAGAAIVIDLASGQELAELRAYDGTPFDLFGTRVAMGSTHIVVGATNDVVNGSTSGSAYVFDRGTYQQVAKLTPSDGAAGDNFGRAVDIVGSAAFVGAKDNGTGAVYRFDLDALPPGSPSCLGLACPCGTDDPNAGCPNSTGQGALLSSAGSASVTADDLVLNVTQLPANQFGLMFMGNAHQQPQLLDHGFLCATGSLRRFGVQNSGAGSIDEGPGLVRATCVGSPAATCITAGASWTFQLWYRDPGLGCSGGSNTSNARTVLFQP